VLLESKVDSPVQQAAAVHLCRIRAIVRALAEDANLREPEKFAQVWHMLMNSRLLGFAVDTVTMGAAATRLAGQRDFTDKGDNRWRLPVRDSLCWPYGVASCGETLVIADSGNNRVLLWEAAP
jgi:hypothetical protein